MTTNISAGLVKELRERTGAGMMECKKALTENAGDIDTAAEWLRKQGLAKADKKADRVAAEGRIVAAQAGIQRSWVPASAGTTHFIFQETTPWQRSPLRSSRNCASAPAPA